MYFSTMGHEALPPKNRGNDKIPNSPTDSQNTDNPGINSVTGTEFEVFDLETFKDDLQEIAVSTLVDNLGNRLTPNELTALTDHPQNPPD